MASYFAAGECAFFCGFFWQCPDETVSFERGVLLLISHLIRQVPVVLSHCCPETFGFICAFFVVCIFVESAFFLPFKAIRFSVFVRQPPRLQRALFFLVGLFCKPRETEANPMGAKGDWIQHIRITWCCARARAQSGEGSMLRLPVHFSVPPVPSSCVCLLHFRLHAQRCCCCIHPYHSEAFTFHKSSLTGL